MQVVCVAVDWPADLVAAEQWFNAWVTGSVSGGGFEAPLWRAIGVFRGAAFGYAAVRVIANFHRYRSPVGGWCVIGVMALWTASAVWMYRWPEGRRWPLLGVDLLVTVACLVAGVQTIGSAALRAGVPLVPGPWIAAPVLCWAVAGGRRTGAVAALLVGAAAVATPGVVPQSAVSGAVLMLLTGVSVGHVARLGVRAERGLQEAVEREAVARERTRLARDIHDSVLQVLALVARRGAEAGGEAAELGRLAGEQEAALRSLVAGEARATDNGDLGAALDRFASMSVTLALPAAPVTLPAPVIDGLVGAVGAGLDNVARHCAAGTRAWVLVEDEADAVVVTVRDDGPGIPERRLAEAARAGRLGIAESIQGRLADLGGHASIRSTPGAGTEVELRVPR